MRFGTRWLLLCGLPGHQRLAPGTDGWCWPLACECSRSLCCGKRSSLWGSGWTCLSSLCSPAEESAVIKPILLVESHMCSSCTVWHLQLRPCESGCTSMTNTSVVRGWSTPCAAQRHIRNYLTRGTAGARLVQQSDCYAGRTENSTCCCFCGCCSRC